MMYDYIIVGAGISGVTAAKLIRENKKKVQILESKPEIGGLIHCVKSSGHLYHKVGGHVFNSNNEKVLDWFWQHFNKDSEFLKTKRKAKIWFKNAYIGYPIENFLYQLPNATVKEVIKDLLVLMDRPRLAPFEYNNFEEFLKGSFGKTLYDLYFKPYNEKIWQYNMAKVPMAWLKGKLPMPNYEDILLKNIMKLEENDMVHSSFYYPKNDGSQFIINRLAKGLDIIRNTSVEQLDLKDGIWIVNGTRKARRLVYTGDVRRLLQYMPKASLKLKGLLEQLKSLPSLGTSNLLCESDAIDLSWLYLPEEKFKAHRIIYTGNFAPSNNDKNTGADRISCTVEFSGKQSWEEMVKEIKSLPGNLTPLDSNYETNSYIIHNHQTVAVMKEIKAGLKDLNFHLLGRFAEWEYYNMDKAIEAAMILTQELEGQGK